MKKRTIAIFTLFFFMVSLFSMTFTNSVKAYQNQSYFSNLKIGLVSMASSTLTITLNGDYSLNGSTVFSGTSLNFKITNGNVNINGTEYSSANLTPLVSTNLLSITNSTKTNKYLGSFSFKVDSGKVLPINSIYVEEYLKGVVGLEMSDSFPMEALKAQAVAARNYALSRVGYCTLKGYDFDDTTNYQVYGGYNEAYKNVIAAVDSTKGQTLLYNDKLVETLYGSSDGGYTEDAINVWGNPTPYLISKPDSYDTQGWPYGNVVLSNSQIDTILKTKKYLTSTDTFVKLDLSSITRYISGRVSNINVIYVNSTGTSVTLPITMDKARTFLGLPSSNYTVTYDPTILSYTFSGKGNGHGLGMSQIGAMNRAKAGQTYDQILKFYYDGSYLQNIIKTASIQSFTINKNSLISGDTVTLNSTAQGGNGFGYLYKYVISKDNSTVYTSDYSNSACITYTPVDAGQYTATLYVKDSFSVNSYDAQQNLSFTVYSAPGVSGLTADKTQLLAGQSINFNAQGQGGSSSYLYKYEILSNNNVIYTKDFSADSTLSYAASTAGNYTVNVYLKDNLSFNTYDASKTMSFTVFNSASLSSLTADKSALLNGQSININAAAQGGSSNYLYKYVISQNGAVLNTVDYSSNAALAYIPNSAGNYEVAVYMKDALSNQTYDDTKAVDFTVYALPVVSSVNASGYMYAGKSVSLSTSVSLGSPLGTNYRYDVYRNGVLYASSSYSISSSFSFTPDAAAVYSVTAYAKDGLSSNSYDSSTQFNLTISKVPLSVASLPIYWGMRGTDVATIQSALNNLGYSVGTVDGIFGQKTYTGLVNFQKAKGLTASGAVDTATFNALNNALIIKAGLKFLTY